MWNEVIDDKTRTVLLEEAGFFHDTCLTELRYVSGAYVGENLGMYPINDKRKVNVFIQRQEVILEDGKIFWCDCDGISKEEFPDYRGISICASELRWRWVDGNNLETERK